MGGQRPRPFMDSAAIEYINISRGISDTPIIFPVTRVRNLHILKNGIVLGMEIQMEAYFWW